jgi:uroporphyrinogen-III synthase
VNHLQNNRILVTRASHQTKSFCKQIESLGAESLLLPMIAIQAIKDQTRIEKELQELENINWIVFTSVNTVHYFFEAIEKYNIKVHFLTDLRIATVGETTKSALEKIGYRSNFVPIEYTAQMLAKQLPIFGDERILIPQSSKANNEYVDLLKDQCKEVITLPIYENYNPEYTQEEFEAIFNPQLDWITFFSGSAVTNFYNHIERYSIELEETQIAVIGPSTLKVLEEYGASAKVMADPYTEDGMIAALKKI